MNDEKSKMNLFYMAPLSLTCLSFLSSLPAEKIKTQEEKVKVLTAEKAKPEKEVAVPIEKDKAEKGEVAQEKLKEKAPAEKSK